MNKNFSSIQLVFESQQEFLLPGGAPDIFEQIAMSRADILQRCFAIQVLRAGRNRALSQTLLYKHL
jgi:hypothetical protein